MAELVREGAMEPVIRESVLPLIGGPYSTDTAELVTAIGLWVHDRMTLVDEPEELVQRPEYLAREIRSNRPVYGDCDDAITLGLAMATAVGIVSRLVAIRPAGSAEYEHVFGECLVRDRRRGVTGWQRLDPTLDGRTWISGPMDTMVVPV